MQPFVPRKNFVGSHKWSVRESMGSQSFHAPDDKSSSSSSFLTPMKAAAFASGVEEKDIPEAVRVTMEPGDVAFHHQVRLGKIDHCPKKSN